MIAILTGFACTRLGPFGDRVAARWDGALDRDRLSRELARGPDAPRLEVVEDLPAD